MVLYEVIDTDEKRADISRQCNETKKQWRYMENYKTDLDLRHIDKGISHVQSWASFWAPGQFAKIGSFTKTEPLWSVYYEIKTKKYTPLCQKV